MNDTFHCADHEALVAYLYDECEPADRAAITAHVAHCAACAEELASLRATRTQLASWTPPAASLGFQITRADGHNEPLAFATRDGVVGPASPSASGPRSSLSSGTPERRSSLSSGTPERRSSWWREPLPAWAQAAAAVLIFAAGLTAGTQGNSPARDAAATAPVAPPAVTAPPAQVVAVAQPAATAPAPAAPALLAADLARLERRLRAIESAQSVPASQRTINASATSVSAADRTISAASVVRGADEATLARVTSQIGALRNDIAILADAVSNMDAQYRNLGRRLNPQVVTAEDLQQVLRESESRGLLTTPVSFPGRTGR